MPFLSVGQPFAHYLCRQRDQVNQTPVFVAWSEAGDNQIKSCLRYLDAHSKEFDKTA